MKKLVALALCILISVPLTGCLTSTETKSAPLGEDLVIGVCMYPLGFHPYMESYDTDTLSLNSNIFNGLVEFDAAFRIIPGLAESWTTPTNRTWRFTLRNNVRFHNGYNFTATDVKYTFDMIKTDTNYNSFFRDLLTCIQEVVIIDTYTVELITVEPCPILLNKLADIFIVSQQYQEENTSGWPIGTGAYKLVDYVDNESLTLERFDDYWNDQPEITKVMFTVIPESQNRTTALLNGTIDLATIDPEDYHDLVGVDDITIQTLTSPTVMYLSFDFRTQNSSYPYGDTNPLGDVRVREAMYAAIDIQQIITEHLKGFADPASQFISPLIFGYNPNITRVPYNLSYAQTLMNQSGYPHWFDLDLDCADYDLVIKLCETIATQLKAIHINVHVNPLPVVELFDKTCSGNSSCFFIGWIPASGDGGELFDYILMTPDTETGVGLYNYGKYSHPEIDHIGTQIACCMNPDTRCQLLQQGFALAMDDVVWIPLYMPQYVYAAHKDLTWTPRGDLSYLVEDIEIT